MIKTFLLSSKQRGFTIVELLVVIVVIAILATISVVAYNGIQRRAHETTLQSDLSGGVRVLIAENALTGRYPVDSSATNDGRGLPESGDNVATYNVNTDGTEYCLQLQGHGLTYFATNSASTPQKGTCNGTTGVPGTGETGGDVGANEPANCPSTGGAWVKVPGNNLYGTNGGFCVQQYPASNVGGVATSQPNGNRWTALTRNNIQTAAATAADGAHLLTENEWMTIAADAAMQPSNWSGGSVGSGTLPVGSSSASRGTYSVVLSNGERVYFDTGTASYHAYVEFTCYTGPSASNCGIPAQNHPTPAGAWRTHQFGSVSSYGALPVSGGFYYGDPRYANPSLAPYATSTSSTGLGYLRSSYAAGSSTTFNTTRGFWNGANTSGLFSLQLLTTETYAHASYGFRAAR